MLFTNGLIKLFVLNLKLFNFIGSYFYDIDPVSQKLTFNSSKNIKNELLCKSAVALMLYTTMVVQLISFRGEFQKVQIYESIFYITFLYLCLGIHIIYFRRGSQVVELFNSLVHFERQQISRGFFGPYSPKRGYTLFLKELQWSSICAPGYVSCFAIHIWLQPCVPFAPGFWILDECSQYVTNANITFTLSGTVSKIYLTCCCLLLVWSMRRSIENNFFVFSQFFFMVAFCLRYYLNSLLAQVRIGNTSLSPSERVRIYQTLQLMIRLFNGINQDIYIILSINIMGVSFVVSLFALITVLDSMAIPQFVIMGSGAIQAPLIILIGYGIFGGIYNNSVQTLQAFRATNACLETRNERKVWRKVVESLGPLKVMIGSVNYVDKLTPGTLFDFFIQILVSLLLLK